MEPDVTTMNARRRYYYAHKDEPEFKENARRYNQKWYEKNKEREQLKALERYYKKKHGLTI